MGDLSLALEREGAVAKVGDEVLGDRGIDGDDLAFGEAALRKIDLVEVGDGQFATVDFDLLFPGHFAARSKKVLTTYRLRRAKRAGLSKHRHARKKENQEQTRGRRAEG